MVVVIAVVCGLAAALAGRGLLGLRAAPRLRILHGLAAGASSTGAADAEPLNQPFSQRILRPMLGGVGSTLGRLLPQRLLASTAAALTQAGVRGRPADWLGAKALVAVGLGAYAALLLHGVRLTPLIVAAALVLGWSLPGAYLKSKGGRRATALRNDLPDAMDLLTVCVEAGLGFDQALLRVVQRFPGPVGEEFGRVLRDQRLGTPRRQAMLALLDRIDLPELRAFIHAVLQAEELGVRIGTVLRVQSDSLRDQRRQRAEETAMKAPIKMAFPMIMLILPALFLVILGPALIQAFHSFGAGRQ